MMFKSISEEVQMQSPDSGSLDTRFPEFCQKRYKLATLKVGSQNQVLIGDFNISVSRGNQDGDLISQRRSQWIFF